MGSCFAFLLLALCNKLLLLDVHFFSVHPLFHLLSAVSFSCLYEQANRTNILIFRGGYVPTAGAGRLHAHFQSNIMPPVRHKHPVAAPRMNTIPVKQKPGVWVSIIRIGDLQLTDFLFIPTIQLQPVSFLQNVIISCLRLHISRPVLNFQIRYTLKFPDIVCCQN